MLSELVVPDTVPLAHAAPRGVAALVDHARPWGNVHDRAARDTLLAQVAGLLGCELLPAVDAGIGRGAGIVAHDALLVPGDTITRSMAEAAGIRDRTRLLGGVVPDTFVGTKAIVHGLVDEAAARPAIWSTALRRMMGEVALTGFAAFSRADAARAGRLLLERGPVRIKDVCGKAGLGQQVVRSVAALEAALALEDERELAHHGIVLEENLSDVVTYSVGAVELGGHRIAYWGSQNLTRDHHGREVYGGSDLFVVRGGFAELAEGDLPPAIRRAVACAATFDHAAQLAYPDMLLTRRNYDVIEGIDAAGERRIGVLEQSWRVGGASGAEIAALEAFRDDPALPHVRCATVEVYDLVTPPAGATVYFRGHDPVAGAMTKYAVRQA